MSGLVLAEVGDSMVEFDVYGQAGGSGFRAGQRIAPDCVTPGGGSTDWGAKPQRPQPRKAASAGVESLSETLSRSDTFLDIGAPARSAAELKSLLGNAQSRLKPGASMFPQSLRRAVSTGTGLNILAEGVALEQAKARARVEVDIVLESETCVQGGYLKGHVKIHVGKFSVKDPPVLLSQGKVRVVGFECIPFENNRCMFYQHSVPFSEVMTGADIFCRTGEDEDGWAEAKEGTHVLPFAMLLPMEGNCGTPKGSLNVHSGVCLRYVAMVSIRIKDALTSKQSIAHFYRHCEIWPRLNPDTVLAPAPRPLVAEASKSLFMGGSGKIKLTAKLHRLYWVAGQHCSVKIRVINDTKKAIKSATITLIRTTTIFRPHPHLDAGNGRTIDPDACQTTTMRKQVAESTLGMGQRCVKGHASAKGWWTGVDPGEALEFAHSIVLPQDVLSVARVRLLEVEYSLRISITTRETWYRKSRPEGGEQYMGSETVPGMKYSNQDTDVVPLSAKPTMTESFVPNSEQMDPSTSIDSGSVYPPTDTATETGTITQSRFEQSPVEETDNMLHRLEINNSFSQLQLEIGGIEHGSSESNPATPTVCNAVQHPQGPREQTLFRMPSSYGEAPLLQPQYQSSSSGSEPSSSFAHRVHNKLVAFAMEDGNASRSLVGREIDGRRGLASRQNNTRSMFAVSPTRMLPKPPSGIVHKGSMSALLASPSAFISGWRSPRRHEDSDEEGSVRPTPPSTHNSAFISGWRSSRKHEDSDEEGSARPPLLSTQKSSNSVKAKIKELEEKMRGN
ncbi:hypothetical protein SERLA73DRAFT_163658 [Serpula lacrymans var. lacrymans S7.3]|uniref:Arrestin C-terminal-like domain-containing protein n=1 Tax=Serpula lacrymans var. lacrymans (strain S7.3) TaxID=936435 RepID=F8QEY1_SERL3|nr:hypothetical protein SERLA73DRAFT_163658 [Serpula lacrymans var. lacrymans S7.3]